MIGISPPDMRKNHTNYRAYTMTRRESYRQHVLHESNNKRIDRGSEVLLRLINDELDKKLLLKLTLIS